VTVKATSETVLVEVVVAVACKVFVLQVPVVSKQEQSVETNAAASDASCERSVASGSGCDVDLVGDVGLLAGAVEDLVGVVGALGFLFLADGVKQRRMVDVLVKEITVIVVVSGVLKTQSCKQTGRTGYI